MITEKFYPNPHYDDLFKSFDKMINSYPMPEEFDLIYEVSKRYFNLHGFDINFIRKIYLLGTIQDEIKKQLYEQKL